MEWAEGLHGEERGAGGKFRKPNKSKPPATPYDRPPPVTEPQVRRMEDGGRWFSKFVDPAARIISGGASRLFPSFFPKPPLASPASDADQPDVKQDDVHDEPQQISDIQMYRPDEGESVSKEAGRPKSGSNTNQQVGDKLDNSSAGTGLSEIERMVKEKVFSREDLHRLTEILYSRMATQPDANDHGKNIPNANKGEKSVVRSLGNDNTKTLAVGKQVDMGPISSPVPWTTSRNEGGTSPVETAKAYMGTQISELGLCSGSIVERDEKTPLPTSLTADGFSPKSSIHSPAYKPSPCWPGAMIQDQHAYTTPQTERGRVRLHNLPRTPYSRTVFSRSTSKFQGSGDRFLNVSSVQGKRSQTSAYDNSQALNTRILLDDDFGSVGPIRRTRQKFAGTVTPTRGPDTFHSLRSGHFFTESSASLLPIVKQKVEPRASTSSSTNFHIVSSKSTGSRLGVSAVHPQSAVMAKKILEHLDRTIPTPQKKLAELKLATSWRRTSSSELTAIRPNAEITESHLEGSNSQQSTHLLGQKSSEEKEVTVKSLPNFPPEQRKIDEATVAVNSNTSTSNAVSSMIGSGSDSIGLNIRPFGNFKKAPDFQVNTHEVSVGLERDENKTNQPFSIQKQTEGYDTSTISHRGNGSKQTFGNKLALASISVAKPGSKQTVPLDNGFGFSFPVSASSGALSEPPTPSIMPISSVGSLPRPQENTTVPSYSFGCKKSGRLVFSFPSTNSSAPNDASTPVFTLGSNEKARMSFRSVGKDAICY